MSLSVQVKALTPNDKPLLKPVFSMLSFAICDMSSTSLNGLTFVNLPAGFFRYHELLQWRRMGVTLVVKLRIRCLPCTSSAALSIPKAFLKFTNCRSMMTTDMMTSYLLLILNQVGVWSSFDVWYKPLSNWPPPGRSWYRSVEDPLL